MLQAGALLFTPAAAAGAPATSPASAADEAQLHDLQARWMRAYNSGDTAAAALLDPERSGDRPRLLTPDFSREPHAIVMRSDGRQATVRFPCILLSGQEVSRDCTFGQMAHAQGCGVYLQEDKAVLTMQFDRAGHTWVLGKVTLT